MLREVQIGEGGLLHSLERSTHLTSLRGQIATVILAVWLPLVCFGLATEGLTGQTEPAKLVTGV